MKVKESGLSWVEDKAGTEIRFVSWLPWRPRRIALKDADKLSGGS